MATLNQSNKATAVFSGSPTLTNVIDALTDLRDSTRASDPVLVFEWDATP
jgi:hypothetical protein